MGPARPFNDRGGVIFKSSSASLGNTTTFIRVTERCSVADVATTNTNPGDAGYGEPDGGVDGADLSYYVEQWLVGCP